MAITWTSGYKTVTGAATQIVAANANRQMVLLRVIEGDLWFGPDNTVDYNSGYYATHTDAPIEDKIPTVGAWYGICRPGKTAVISYLEVSG